MRNLNINLLREQNTEAIIFDLGGVILNLDTGKTFDAFIKLGFNNIENELGRILNKASEKDEPGLFHLYETGKISSGQFREGLRKIAGSDLHDSDIDKAWTAMLLDLPQGNLRLLERLTGYFRIFLLSNTNAIHIESLHALPQDEPGYSSLVKLFEKVYYSHELGMRKPDAGIFQYVIEDAGVKAENTLFIDDSLINVEGARSAGLLAYHHTKNASLDSLFDFGG
jgi:glucose-1-phosphatase